MAAGNKDPPARVPPGMSVILSDFVVGVARRVRQAPSLAGGRRGSLRMTAAAACLVAVGCGGSPGAGPAEPSQPTPTAPPVTALRWERLLPASGPVPEPRSYGVAVYDPDARRLVVFGGEGAQALLNDTWAFDLASRTWTPLATLGPRPEPRFGATAVYDPQGRQMVVWSGQGSRFFDDTWTLDLRTLEWRDVSPSRRPQARYGSASVLDPAERRLVQFAGFTSLFSRFEDTQGFDLDTGAWDDLTPPAGLPGARCLHTAALDSVSRRMIVYGGQQSGPLDDLWSFDLATRQWTERTPPSRPSGRMLAVSFVDREGRFLVFGGSTRAGQVSETWAFRLATGEWSRLDFPEAPPPREAPLAAYSEAEERFLVFGGEGDGLLNDLWQLRRVPIAAGLP